MKLTLETKHRTVVIELPHDEQSIMDIVDDLISPAILAMGYSQQNLEDYFVERALQIEHSQENDGLSVIHTQLSDNMIDLEPNIEKVVDDNFEYLIDDKPF